MAKTLLLLIIAFVTLDFVLSSVLSWLNTRWMTHPVPPELEGLYDEEKYRKQQDYRINYLVSNRSRTCVWCRLLGPHKKNRIWAGICHLSLQCHRWFDSGAVLKENRKC